MHESTLRTLREGTDIGQLFEILLGDLLAFRWWCIHPQHATDFRRSVRPGAPRRAHSGGGCSYSLELTTAPWRGLPCLRRFGRSYSRSTRLILLRADEVVESGDLAVSLTSVDNQVINDAANARRRLCCHSGYLSLCLGINGSPKLDSSLMHNHIG